MMVLFHRECDHCKRSEERTFTDSWTGIDLCLTCLAAVAKHVTNSPFSEGDNILEELRERTI